MPTKSKIRATQKQAVEQRKKSDKNYQIDEISKMRNTRRRKHDFDALQNEKQKKKNEVINWTLKINGQKRSECTKSE